MTQELEDAFERELRSCPRFQFVPREFLPDMRTIGRTMFQSGILMGMQNALDTMHQTFLKENADALTE